MFLHAETSVHRAGHSVPLTKKHRFIGPVFLQQQKLVVHRMRNMVAGVTIITSSQGTSLAVPPQPNVMKNYYNNCNYYSHNLHHHEGSYYITGDAEKYSCLYFKQENHKHFSKLIHSALTNLQQILLLFQASTNIIFSTTTPAGTDSEIRNLKT